MDLASKRSLICEISEAQLTIRFKEEYQLESSFLRRFSEKKTNKANIPMMTAATAAKIGKRFAEELAANGSAVEAGAAVAAAVDEGIGL